MSVSEENMEPSAYAQLVESDNFINDFIKQRQPPTVEQLLDQLGLTEEQYKKFQGSLSFRDWQSAGEQRVKDKLYEAWNEIEHVKHLLGSLQNMLMWRPMPVRGMISDLIQELETIQETLLYSLDEGDTPVDSGTQILYRIVEVINGKTFTVTDDFPPGHEGMARANNTMIELDKEPTEYHMQYMLVTGWRDCG